MPKMSPRSRLGPNLAAGAMIVLGAGAVLQPAGAARADPVTADQKVKGWDPDKINASAYKPHGAKPILHDGQYTRKKLPGRMKSGAVTIGAATNATAVKAVGWQK